jgi:hypothetical protein
LVLNGIALVLGLVIAAFMVIMLIVAANAPPSNPSQFTPVAPRR